MLHNSYKADGFFGVTKPLDTTYFLGDERLELGRRVGRVVAAPQDLQQDGVGDGQIASQPQRVVPIEIFLKAAFEKKVAQFPRVGQTLEHRVHEASVAHVVQAGHAEIVSSSAADAAADAAAITLAVAAAAAAARVRVRIIVEIVDAIVDAIVEVGDAAVTSDADPE